MDRKSKIKEFVNQYSRNHELGDDHDIFALGFINSLFAMQLVMFVETEFGITVEDDDLDIENFKTINAIEGLILRKCGQVSAA